MEIKTHCWKKWVRRLREEFPTMAFQIFEKISFWVKTDRIGPDIPLTHWMLYFKETMLHLCKKKFKYFHDSADFRPGAYAVICSKISIGKRVVIRPGTVLHADPQRNGARITIEDDVLIGQDVHVYVDKHRFDNTRIPILDQSFHPSKKVLIKKGCWIGAGCIILPGVTIGENSVVGAGSIVTKNIPARTVAVGNPAHVIKKIRNSK